MCGKYYVESEEENLEIRHIIGSILRTHPDVPVRTGAIVPSLCAPVLPEGAPAPMVFGLALSGMPRLVINARAEGAATSRLFSGLLTSHRCLVPASCFYEWSEDKKAHAFAGPGGGLLYMAGLYQPSGPLPRFVIITRSAQGSVAAVHPRMPLLFDSAELREAWLRSPLLARELLRLNEPAELMEITPPA